MCWHVLSHDGHHEGPDCPRALAQAVTGAGDAKSFAWHLLRSKRSTIYNLYRVPLNAIVVLTLICKFGEGVSFCVRRSGTQGVLCVDKEAVAHGHSSDVQ